MRPGPFWEPLGKPPGRTGSLLARSASFKRAGPTGGLCWPSLVRPDGCVLTSLCWLGPTIVSS
eukprot:1102143-Alexandrium_andersonii.AAC.1